MTNLTRRSVPGGSLVLTAGSLARPFIANAAARAASLSLVQGFVQEEDVAFKKLVAGYETASGKTIVPFAPAPLEQTGNAQVCWSRRSKQEAQRLCGQRPFKPEFVMIADVHGSRPSRTAWQSPKRLGHRAALPRLSSAAYPIAAQFGHLRGDVDSIQATSVFTQYLAFDLDGEVHMVFLF